MCQLQPSEPTCWAIHHQPIPNGELDRLVIGIRDQQLSKRIQLEPELTLAKAEKFIHQRAAIGQLQQKEG